MGTSTDGILLYGLCFTDDDTKPWHRGDEDRAEEDLEDEGWEARYAYLKGLVPSTLDYPNRNDLSDEANVAREAHQRYWRKKGALVAESPCEVVAHCCDGCVMYGVAIKASHMEASRGNPAPIEARDLVAKPEWEKQVREFCELMGIRVQDDDRVGWWLTSWWG